MDSKKLTFLVTCMAISLTASAAMAQVKIAPAPAPKAPEEKPKTHALSKEAKFPVVTCDSTGGMIMRQNDEPLLQILADGTITAGDPWGAGRKVEGKMTAEEIQTLLGFILDQQKLADIKPDDLIVKGMAPFTDSSVISLIVEADGAKQQVSARSLEFVADHNGPDSPAGHLLAITHRLDQLINVTKLGGQAAFQKLLDAANSTLKAKNPDDGLVAAQDLARADAPADGSVVASFNHKVTLPSGQWHMVIVTVTQPKTSDLTIKIQKSDDQPAP